MNVFVLDADPIEAARAQCDRHVVKMPLETAQMLCTIARLEGVEVPYRPTHQNHPCTRWARESQQNAEWLVRHGLALCEEYRFRYGRTHACERVITDLMGLPDRLPDVGMTPFAQAMPERYRDADAVRAYRAYYVGEKKDIATWRTRQPPAWWIEEYYAE